MKNKKGRIVILPYKMGSESAEAFAKELKVLRIHPDETKTKFVGRDADVIVNWGNSTFMPQVRKGETPSLINHPRAVRVATDKLETFKVLSNSGVPVPEFTTERQRAEQWLRDEESKRIFCRTILNSHSGNGIVIARKDTEVVNAPLYVKGIPKDREFRVHVLRNVIFDRQEKKARAGIREQLGEDWVSDVRSHANGWVFTRENVTIPKEVEEAAIKAVAALGLDFGAVDICCTKKGVPFVLEINTAPSLQGTTLELYTKVFNKFLGFKE